VELVDLICKNCNNEFKTTDSQYKYQEKKKPGRDWFCSRSCTCSYTNKFKRSPEDIVKRNARIKEFSGRGSKPTYNQQFVWYTKRIAFDHRFENISKNDRLAVEHLLESAWKNCNGLCAFSKLPLSLRNHKGKADTTNTFVIASVDRIDSSLPYQEGNIQWVSCGLNLAKGNATNQEFLQWLQVLNFTSTV